MSARMCVYVHGHACVYFLQNFAKYCVQAKKWCGCSEALDWTRNKCELLICNHSWRWERVVFPLWEEIGVEQSTLQLMKGHGSSLPCLSPHCLLWCVYVWVGADEQWQRAEERLVYGVESNSTLLECVPRSLQAKVLWFLQKGGEKHEVSAFLGPWRTQCKRINKYFRTNWHEKIKALEKERYCTFTGQLLLLWRKFDSEPRFLLLR